MNNDIIRHHVAGADKMITIGAAGTACEVSGQATDNHFVNVNKLVERSLASERKKSFENPDGLDS